MGIEFNNVGKSGYIQPQTPSVGNNAKTGRTGEITTPIPITGGTDSVKRTDLDMVNPYGFLGVNLTGTTKPTNIAQVIDNYCTAAPEFGLWSGNYTITNRQEAADLLGGYARAVQDYEQVAANFQGSPFADLLG